MTLEQILQRIGSYVDQDSSTPTGTDLTVRISYVNRALDEWAITYDWLALKQTFSFMPTMVSQTSVGLPSNFKKMESPLYDYGIGDATRVRPFEYPEIREADRFRRDINDQYFYIMGDRRRGFNLIVPKGMSSGASMLADISVFPSSLATLTHISPMNDPDYLVYRGVAYVLEARGDARFPQAKIDAEKSLARMVEHENAFRFAGGVKFVANTYEKMASRFRIGRRGS